MKSLITILLALAPLSGGVYAQDLQVERSTFPKPREALRGESQPHVGILAGVASPEGRFDSTDEVGIDIGYQPYVPMGLGLELTYLDSTGEARSLRKTQLLAKGLYNFGGNTPIVRNGYMGVGVGTSFTSNATRLVSAPILGFDIPLEKSARDFFSLGANAKYAIVEGSEADVLSLTGVLKYWF